MGKPIEAGGFITDRPVSREEEDKLQRYGFSKKVAQAIIDIKDKAPIVFGIYGTWGEGKTSVINFIQSEIDKDRKDRFIQVKFNPWRFTGEENLLFSFFDTLAKEISNLSFNPSKVKEIGRLLKRYGSLIPKIGKVLHAIGEEMSEVSVETLKSRIDKALENFEKRIIVYLDDMDRLDKSEMHAMFRLVKLTADFPNVVYVLAFDKDVVASAIGERYGAGDKQAGESFIEKIVQVPLHIAKAHPEELEIFCKQLTTDALEKSNVKLSEVERERFDDQFTANISSCLTTPRLAVRYVNALSLVLPLIHKEVNEVDLMLITALGVFYPAHYNFVRNNHGYFVQGVNEFKGVSEQAPEVKKYFDELSSYLTEQAQRDVKNLLSDLFPYFKAVLDFDQEQEDSQGYSGLDKMQGFTEEQYDTWSEQKRIASLEYFDRYFAYSVPKRGISDAAFESLLGESKHEE